MPSSATHKDVTALSQAERGGRRPKAMRQTAERRRNVVARLCGKERRSIHHRFASKPEKRNSPRTFKSANPPRNKARPRGKAFQRKLSSSNFFISSRLLDQGSAQAPLRKFCFGLHRRGLQSWRSKESH